MPSFKECFQSLLDLFVKKSEKEWIGNQAMPGGQRINIQLPTETATTGWVAPQDGYVHVQGSSIVGLDLQVSPNGTNVGIQTFWPKPGSSVEQEYIAFSMPVRKGQHIGIRVWCSDRSKLDNAWFEPCTGSS